MDAMTALIKDIDEDIQQLNQVISSGSISDFAEYKYLCGQILGLTKCLYYVKDMEKRLQQSDD